MFNYDWAENKMKLELAVKSLEKAKLLDPRVEISEETIKEAYIKRAGRVLTTEQVEKAIEKKSKKK